MRRVLLALLALSLCAGSAWPRAIVLYGPRPVTTSNIGGPVKIQESDNITLAVVRACLDKFNPGGYDIGQTSKARMRNAIGEDASNTKFIQDGWYQGTQYSEVVWLASPQTNVGNMVGCAPCSLTAIGDGAAIKMPSVPQLFIAPPAGESQFNPPSASCSTGFNNETYDPDLQGPGYATTRFKVEGTPYVWGAPNGIATSVPQWRGAVGGTAESTFTGATPLSGGYRIIIGGHASAYEKMDTKTGTAGCVDRDSLVGPYNWMSYAYSKIGARYNTYFPTPDSAYGMKFSVNYNESKAYTPWGTSPYAPIAYCDPGTTTMLDVGGNAFTVTGPQHRVRISPELVFASLAWLDSLTGHDVLGVRPKGQIRLAVQIDGGWERNNWRVPSSGGIDPVDTTGVLQASIDSLKALGIPIAVMVNCDSLNQYPNDKSWWARNPNFVYEVYDAISTASAPASYALYKNQLAGFYASMDSCFGRSRVDRVFTGYEGDDWTPADIQPQSAAKWDSLMWAYSSLGITGVSNDAEADSEATASVARGWPGPQTALYSTLLPGRYITKLCFPGYSNRGALEQHGRVFYSSTMDTTATSTGAGTIQYRYAKQRLQQDSTLTMAYVERSTFGALLPFWQQDYDANNVFRVGGDTGTNGWYGEPALTGQVSQKANTHTGCNLVRITASSLGAGQFGTGSPARPGFYQIKYLVNIARAINTLAGRQLIVFVRPDQLNAKDIQR